MFNLFGLATSISGAYTLTISGTLTASRTFTAPDASMTLAGQDYANTFTAAQTIDIQGGAFQSEPTTSSGVVMRGSTAGTPIGFAGVNAGSTALTLKGFASSGTRSSMTALADAQTIINFGAFGYDGSAWSGVRAQHSIVADGLWSGANNGTRHIFTGTLNGATALSTWLILRGTNSTDPSGTLGIGVTPTAGNGLLQLLSGTTKAYGVAGGTDAFFYRDATGSWAVNGFLRSIGPTSGIGYATGAGGTVTQGTSRTTGVTLDKVCGEITLFSAAGSATATSFTVTNSAMAATDNVVVNQKSGTDLYIMSVTAKAAGSFRITFYTTGGTTVEQPVFSFSIIKSVAA